MKHFLYIVLWGGLFFTLINSNKLQAQVINKFPYINYFDTEDGLSDWTLVNAKFEEGYYHKLSVCCPSQRIHAGLELNPQWGRVTDETPIDDSYFLLEPCYIETPELNLTGLENPTLIFELLYAESCIVYSSTNGEDYQPLLVCSKDANSISIPKNTKYIRFQVVKPNDIDYGRGVEEWNYYERRLTYIQILDKKIISSFPYVENFETENATIGWTSSWVYLVSSTTGGILAHYSTIKDGYMILPELNLESLVKPTIETELSSNYRFIIKGSMDGENYIEYNDDWTNYLGKSELSPQDKYIMLEFRGAGSAPYLSVSSLKIYDSVSTSISKKSIEEVFPFYNPSKGTINILPEDIEITKLRLFDQTGRLQKEEVGSAMNIENFPSSVYLLQIIIDGETINRKIVKK